MDISPTKVLAVAALAGVALLALLSGTHGGQNIYSNVLSVASHTTSQALQAIHTPQGALRRFALATAGGVPLPAPPSVLTTGAEAHPDKHKYVTLEVVQPGNGKDSQRGQMVEVVPYVGKPTTGVQFDSNLAVAPKLSVDAAGGVVYCDIFINVIALGTTAWYQVPASSGSSRFDCLLESGVNGEGVGALQRALNSCYGAGIDEDSKFGPATYNALMKVQRTEGINIDGVYGQNTRSHLRWPSKTTTGNCAHGYEFGL
eukprot:EG_transcript_15571